MKNYPACKELTVKKGGMDHIFVFFSFFFGGGGELQENLP